jgi:fructose-1,6-bisphosphatase/inositol monophosphatase family enzyme
MDSKPTDDIALRNDWMPQILALSDRLRDATIAARTRARASGTLDALAREASQGAGDVTFGIDVPAEDELTRWLEEVARKTPLSLLSEDAGWRHMGPGARGRATELSTFDHGGPRIVVDPIDGTRNLMTDLRSAWSTIALCAPGADEPRMSDVALGVLSEIPDSRAELFRRMSAARGGRCRLEVRELVGAQIEELALAETLIEERTLDTGADDRVDHGYFPFFKYMPDMRAEIARIEAAFFELLAVEERADVQSCWDDQYLSNAGQLALLALGKYRMIADLRAHLAERRGRATLTSKPYDIAGALICARAAGCAITAADGAALDFPLDAKTPVSFVGWVNRATQERVARHLARALGSA